MFGADRSLARGMNQEPGSIFTVNSRKFDGSIRKSWECALVWEDAEKINLFGSFATQVEHRDLGIIEAGTVSHERFYFNRWYNYFIFEHPRGTLRNYYINICMPPVIVDRTIDYVDLDIDLIVWPDGRCQTLDVQEFEANRIQFGYPDHVVNRALATLAELEGIIRKAKVIDLLPAYL
jgi:protein associated with RNAse G/E